MLRTATTTSIVLPKQTSSIGITADCRLQCDSDPLQCPAFQVNYLSARCDRLDRNSQGRQLELVERDGESYFERVCLRVPAAARSSCRDKLWTFERVLGYELAHAQYERVLEHVLSRRDCEEFCLQERSFACRSALYDDESAVCRLSRHDRRSRPSAFIRNNNLRISYLENQCAPPARLCPYQSTANAYPTYTDLVVNVTGLGPGEQSACEQRCNQSREFLCRSFAFYASTGECFLSGDDTLSGYLSAISSRSAMHYQEQKCTARHELMPELPEDGTEDHGDGQQLADARDSHRTTMHADSGGGSARPDSFDRTHLTKESGTSGTGDVSNTYTGSTQESSGFTRTPTHESPIASNRHPSSGYHPSSTTSTTIPDSSGISIGTNRWNSSSVTTGMPNGTDRTFGSIESPIQTTTETQSSGDQHNRPASTHLGRRGWAGPSTASDSTLMDHLGGKTSSTSLG